MRTEQTTSSKPRHASQAPDAVDLLTQDHANVKALFAQEYVSRQEYEQAVQTRKSAEAQLAQSKAAADKDRVNLAYTTIRSPVSGIVVDRVVDLGQTVAASLQTPTLIKIAQDLSEMRIDSSFAEADIHFNSGLGNGQTEILNEKITNLGLTLVKGVCAGF